MSVIFALTLLVNSSDYKILKNGKEITLDDFEKLLYKANIVYVGETHTSTFSHIVQLDVIKILNRKKGSNICVGFEMLNKTLQPFLDEYVEGKIDEDEFLEKVNWQKEWGFDFNLYKPIFDFIREKKLKALALNLPRSIVSKVARGGLEALNEDERRLLPQKINITKDKKYNTYLKETFYAHNDNPMRKIMKFENYKLAMAVWNENMGDVISNFIKSNPDYSCVVIAGSGHIMYNAAIPWSVKKRTKGLKHLSVYTQEAYESNEIDKISDYADIVILKDENKMK